MKIKCTQEIINEILVALSSNGLIFDDKLRDVKMVLDMCLGKYQHTYEESTELSMELDPTEKYLQQFLLDMHMRGCTKGSINGYTSGLRMFLDYLNLPINRITHTDIMRFLVYGKMQRGWGDKTYNSRLIQIRSFFNYLYSEDLLPNNPAKKLRETKVEHKIGSTVDAYQREEIKSACKDERELALCEMLYSTGARVSELVDLNREDIDFTNMKAIVYGKGRKEREIYFTAPAKLHLERYLNERTDDNPALFVGEKKPFKRISTGGVRLILKKIKERDEHLKDIKLSPHTYRRSVGCDMVNKGAPLELIAEKLGHVQLDTTKKCYAAISKETVRRAHIRYVA